MVFGHQLKRSTGVGQILVGYGTCALAAAVSFESVHVFCIMVRQLWQEVQSPSCRSLLHMLELQHAVAAFPVAKFVFKNAVCSDP